MGAQRTIACPSCQAPRVTKATGRQRLACTSCARSFLVRDADEIPAPAPAAAPAPAVVAAGDVERPAVEVPALAAEPSQPAGIGGVQVLPPATLRISPPVFDGNPPEATEPPVETPAGPGEPEPPAPVDPPPSPPAAVSAGPGRRLGYYGKVTGR